MPIKVQKELPARTVLESENIFIMDEDRETGYQAFGDIDPQSDAP